MLRAHLLFAVLSLAFAVAACGDDDDGESGGTLQVTAEIEPDPPQVGQNTLHIEVHDDAGAAVEGATITVDPQMPAMGHGSPEEAVVTEVGGGQYDAFPVTLMMAGDWVVTVHAEHGADSGDLVLDYSPQ